MTTIVTQEAKRRPLDALALLASDELARAEATADELRRRLEEERGRIKQRLEELVAEARASHVHVETGDFDAFLEKPYCLVPLGKDEWRVVVPRFVDFHVGILERSTGSYNIFRVNRFARWIGNVPDDVLKEFHFKEPLPAVVVDGEVHVRGKADQDAAWDRYSKHLTRREGETKIRVKPGSEFQLIADMINDGTLPFTAKPIAKQHYRDTPAWEPGFFGAGGQPIRPSGEIKLRAYQERAWAELQKRGAIGVYWPPSAGKTYITLYALAHLKGPHLIVVPTSTLEEQWVERIKRHLRYDAQREVEVMTYAAFDRLRRIMAKRDNSPWTLVVFDECHVLPANTFSKFSTVPTHYRMGLSATPYREDGRTDLIFALTGQPVGLDWQELIDLGIIEVPTITLSLLPDEPSKTTRLEQLLKDGKRTLVFCDGIDSGNALARRLGCAFVDGSSSKRLDTIRRELATKKVVVCSRVADEGVSLQELERVVEVEFLFGSRRQEGQRLGRLFHADARGEHWIFMTRDEHAKHEKRLLAIREKGFRIRLEAA